MSELRAQLVVIGAGPAGIAAAACAAESGLDTLLVYDAEKPGGQIWRPGAGVPRIAAAWLERLARSGARMQPATSVVDAVHDGQWRLLAEQDARAVHIGARALIIATGARERFLPFPGCTLPGIIGVGAAQALVKSGMSVHGRRVVVAGSGPLLFPVAASLQRAGATVALVAEQASASAVQRFAFGLWRTPARIVDAARYRTQFRAPYRTGTWVTHARGASRVSDVVMMDGSALRCDLLCVGYGLVPSTELPRLLGCEMSGGSVGVDATQRTSVPDVYCAGEPTGIAGMAAALVQGQIAGYAAAGRDGRARKLYGQRARQAEFASRLDRAFALRAELRTLAQPDTIVCRCEDATFESIAACVSARDAKLYARAGMGPCQGRVCGPALELMFGWQPDSVRPPLSPTMIGTLADER